MSGARKKHLQNDRPAASEEDRSAVPGDSLEAMLTRPALRDPVGGDAREPIRGVVIGTLAELSPAGRPRVRYPGSPGGGVVEALATEAVTSADVGREVALGFLGGDPLRPLILGFMVQPASDAEPAAAEPVDVRVDGESITLTGKKQVVLQCGKASITLTRAGKVIIKGAYLSSRSSGVNRIKGGSVQIN